MLLLPEPRSSRQYPSGVQILNADEKALVMRKSRVTAAAGGHEYEATVTAMGRTLDVLSWDIAAALLTLAQPALRREYGAHEHLPAVAWHRPLDQPPREASGSSR